MGLTEPDHRQLARRLQDEAAENRAGYHRKLTGLTAVGTGLLWLVALGFTALTACGVMGLGFGFFRGGLLAGLLFAPIPAFAVYLAGSQLFKMVTAAPDTPSHYTLDRTDCPELFDVLESLRQKFDSPTIDEVVVTDEWSVDIQFVPRLGWLGLPKRRLLLGLPMMNLLEPDEFEAVLAQALARVSDSHSDGLLTHWCDRCRQTWLGLANNVDLRSSEPPVLVGRFVVWFVPYFNAYSSVLSRSIYIDADARAAETSDAGTLARGLAKIAVAHECLEEAYYSRVDATRRNDSRQSSTAEDLIDAIETTLAERWDQMVERILDRAILPEAPTPSLSLRLSELDVDEPTDCGPPDLSASEQYLTEVLEEVTDTLNRGAD